MDRSLEDMLSEYRYERKTQNPVLAVKWTGDNLEEVRKVYPGLGEEYMRDNGCGIGYYVICPQPGRVYFMYAAGFEELYQPVRLSVQGEELPELDEAYQRRISIARDFYKEQERTIPLDVLLANEVQCRERQLRAALAEIRRLKGELEVEKALVETFTLPQEFAVADLYYDERGDQTDYGRVIDAVMQTFARACEKRFPSDYEHDLVYDSDGDIEEAIHFVASGMMNRASETGEKSLSASRADALKEALRRHAIHMSYDSPGDVPEPCGLWCELCSEHVEDDRVTGHKSNCLLSETPVLARMEKAS